MRLHKFRINANVWGAYVIVCWGGSANDLERLLRTYYFKKEGLKGIVKRVRESTKIGGAYTLRSGVGTMVVYLPGNPKKMKWREMNIITHELFHCVFDIMDRRNIQLNGATEEAFAYLMGHLTEVFWRKARKK